MYMYIASWHSYIATDMCSIERYIVQLAMVHMAVVTYNYPLIVTVAMSYACVNCSCIMVVNMQS